MSLVSQKTKQLAILNSISNRLDEALQEEYGFSYSNTGDEQIIDALQYGTCGISPSVFIEKMDEYKLKNVVKSPYLIDIIETGSDESNVLNNC